MNAFDMFKDDLTKQWSLSRVSAAVIVVANVFFALYVVKTKGQFPDLGNNWLILILALYGMNKGATVAKSISVGTNKVELG